MPKVETFKAKNVLRNRSSVHVLEFLPARFASFLIQRLYPDEVRVTLGGFTHGSPRDLGELLFTDYLLPFEVTSVLILVAIIGAVVLAGRETR